MQPQVAERLYIITSAATKSKTCDSKIVILSLRPDTKIRNLLPI